MGDDQIKRLELAIERINAIMGEKCTHHQVHLEKHDKDLDKYFDKLRALEKLLHGQNLVLARWSVGASVVSAVLTAAAIKFFVV